MPMGSCDLNMRVGHQIKLSIGMQQVNPKYKKSMGIDSPMFGFPIKSALSLICKLESMLKTTECA